jgi:Ca2+-binding EF-hand superfamily protein
MQATPQQVSGGSLYSHKTRLGNWQEEIAIGNAKLENFRKRSESGSLALRKQEIKITRCNEVVPHTYTEDGTIKFGDTIILSHDETGTILSCDPFEDMVQGQERFCVCASDQQPAPKARHTFRVVRPPKRLEDAGTNSDDPYLRYGQAFQLQCSESLLLSQTSQMLAPMLYLCSCKKNERTATRTTNRQMVYMSPRGDADSVWQFILPSKGKKNASERFLALGREVNVEDSVQLTHRQTNQYLTCDRGNSFESEFGVEIECYCDRDSLPGKLGLMISEFEGKSTAMTLAKPDRPAYGWHIITASTADACADNRDSLPPSATVEQIKKELVQDVTSRGIDGFWNLRAFFMALDKKAMNVGKIDREDLKEAVVAFGTSVEPRYLDTLLDTIDTAHTGLLPWKDYILTLRNELGGLSDARQNVLMEAFAIIDTVGNGRVALDDLAYCFNGADHPLCTIGELSSKDALTHMFLACSERGRMPETITYAQFVDYFEDLSACVNDDGYFEALIKSIWVR